MRGFRAAHRIRSALRWQEQNRPGGQSPAKSLDAPDPYLFLLVVKILVRKQPDSACRCKSAKTCKNLCFVFALIRDQLDLDVDSY